jgi:hypothetical protein
MTIKHLRSSTLNKRPQPSGMVDGQLAINTASGSPGLFFKDTNGSLVKIGPVHVGSSAPNVSPASGGTTGNSVGEQWLDTSGGTYVFKIWDGAAWRSESGEFVNVTGDTMTGSLTMGTSADIIFEGSVDDGFETTLTVANPTADRTITLPDVTGSVVTTGDTGSVTSTMIVDGTIVNGDINASAAIADTKLGTISTANKVSLSALNIDAGTDIGAALADADLFIVDDGGAGTNRKAAATRITDYAFGKVSGDITIGSTGTAAIGAGVIVNADVSASAEIAVSKLGNGTARQLIQTDTTGSGVEWTSNIDIPGTLDVTGTAVFDSSVAVTGTLTKSGSNVVTVGDTGTVTSTMIADDTIVNTDVNASAAIAGTKISPDFGSQNVTTTGTATAAALIPSGSSVPTNGVYLPSANNVAISTNGTGRLFIDASGRVLAGTNTAIPQGTNVGFGRLQVLGTSSTQEFLGRFSADASASVLAFLKSRNATIGSHTIVNSGDTLGQINFQGSDGIDYLNAALIRTDVDSTPGTNSMPGRLLFCTASSASGPTERMRIDSSGRVGIGSTTVDNKFQVVGDVGIGDIGASGTYDLYWAPNVLGSSVRWFRSEGGSFILGRGATAGSNEDIRIDSSGRLLVGTSTSAADYGDGGYGIGQFARAGSSQLHLARHENGGGGPFLVGAKSRGATANENVIVQNGDTILGIGANGATGTGYKPCGNIQFQIDGTTISSTSMPGRITFSTSSSGSVSPAERLRITSDGKIGLGTSSPSAKFQINVQDGFRFDVGTNAYSYMQFGSANTGEGTGEIGFERATGNVYIKNGTSGSTLSTCLTVQNTGRVGIGTTSPGTLLHLQQSSGGTYLRFTADSATANGDQTVDIQSIKAGVAYHDLRVDANAHVYKIQGNERARIDSSGRLLVGTSASVNTTALGNAQVQVVGTTNETAQLSISRFSNDSDRGRLVFIKSRGSSGTNTVVQADDAIGRIEFLAADGGSSTAYPGAANIGVFVDGTPGLNDMPGRLVFSTTADGASSSTERMRITSDAYVRLASGTGGIQFNGDTAAANALDDYEEGTFTPTVSQGFTSPTYGANTAGIYTKVGNTVRVHLRLVLTGGTATASQIRIASLPFACQNTASQYVTCTYYLNAGAGTIGDSLKPLVTPGQSYIDIYLQGNTGVTAVAGTTLGNTMDIILQAVYQV